MFFEHPDDVGVITYGITSQINSSIVNLEPKKLYIIDLTRAVSSNDSQEYLISAVESCKNGMISKMMYGEGLSILMEPPHIVIMGNYELNRKLLSRDRWKVFKIKDKKLIRTSVFKKNRNRNVKIAAVK
jgi:hypothetical protein|uniref:Uncharacterized protein n=1 Tax=Pseudo-nitzschia multiseries TaxID=37319 RepID=A0A0K1DC33_PSEMU|nr:hypothetical protein [Pseudo-nitzschia multiseries]AKT26120.1 hypothetical protein [Pseudo-nitzschia multiseries]UBA15519.1 hypothetical protein [Pseudo-nitzschia multiseries]